MSSWLCETNASQINLRPCSLRGWQACTTSYLPCLMVTLSPVTPLLEHSPVEEEKNIRNTLVRSTPLIVTRAWTTHKSHTHNTRSLQLLFPAPLNYTPTTFVPSVFTHNDHTHYILDPKHTLSTGVMYPHLHPRHTNPDYPFTLTPRPLST